MNGDDERNSRGHCYRNNNLQSPESATNLHFQIFTENSLEHLCLSWSMVQFWPFRVFLPNLTYKTNGSVSSGSSCCLGLARFPRLGNLSPARRWREATATGPTEWGEVHYHVFFLGERGKHFIIFHNISVFLWFSIFTRSTVWEIFTRWDEILGPFRTFFILGLWLRTK